MIYERFCIKVCISSILPKVDDLKKKKKKTNKQTNKQTLIVVRLMLQLDLYTL